MNPASRLTISGSPWSWIPSIYLAEGLPNAIVTVLTVTMYTNLGIGKADMAFYTGLLYLPWVIKPFWSPLVDLIRTKRFWILAMQIGMAVSLLAISVLLNTSGFFYLSLIAFWIMAFLSATHDIAADGFYMLALNSRKQASFVGIRSTFFRIAVIIGQGGIIILAGWLEQKYENIQTAWSLTFAILCILFVLIFLWDWFVLPYPPSDKGKKNLKLSLIFIDFIKTFIMFFKKRYIWIAIAFMLLYRFPEALCLKLVQPFLLDSREMGGLALTTSQVGFANGVVGVISLLAGGVLGGVLIGKNGLNKWLWPMALSLTLPCIIYCLFAIYQPENYVLICSGLGIEQFGYGFGFTAFMMYMMYFSQGENQTSNYAFCTAFMALGLMLPGMFAGYIFNKLSGFVNAFTLAVSEYTVFFIFIMLSCLATFFAVIIVRRTLGPSSIKTNKE